jgi:hypothetical protein
MIFTKDLMRSKKVIFIGDVYVALALRGLNLIRVAGRVYDSRNFEQEELKGTVQRKLIGVESDINRKIFLSH